MKFKIGDQEIDIIEEEFYRMLEEISGVSSVYRGDFYKHYSTDDWMNLESEAYPDNWTDYPNAVSARKIRDSKLYKVLK